MKVNIEKMLQREDKMDILSDKAQEIRNGVSPQQFNAFTVFFFCKSGLLDIWLLVRLKNLHFLRWTNSLQPFAWGSVPLTSPWHALPVILVYSFQEMFLSVNFLTSFPTPPQCIEQLTIHEFAVSVYSLSLHRLKSSTARLRMWLGRTGGRTSNLLWSSWWLSSLSSSSSPYWPLESFPQKPLRLPSHNLTKKTHSGFNLMHTGHQYMCKYKEEWRNVSVGG